MTDKSNKTVSVQAGRGASQPHENAFAPLVDIYEDPDGTAFLVAEMPGAAASSVDVRVEKGVLTILAEAPVDEPGQEYSRTYTSFTGGQYFRAFALSDEVDRDKIEAALADGVLTLRLPKAAQAQTRKIEIKGE